jgi:hypothetical protein
LNCFRVSGSARCSPGRVVIAAERKLRDGLPSGTTEESSAHFPAGSLRL